jgi:hypothetical protein
MAARQAASAKQAVSTAADEKRALEERLAMMEQRLAAMSALPRPDLDAIQGIGRRNILPVDDQVPVPEPEPMSAGEAAALKDLSELREHAATLSTAFLASEERVVALEAKVTKKGAKAAAKVTAQTKDTLLSESEDEGSTEDSDSDDDATEPPKKSIKLGTLSDVLINKIMKVNLTRDWTSDVNKSTFKFNKCIYKGIRSAVKLIEAKKPSQGRDALLKANQKLGERQHMVLLADNSEAGWLTVKNYEGDDWALSGKDQLKMAKAETKAMKTLESQLAVEAATGASVPKGGYTKPAYSRVNHPSHKASLPKSAGIVNVQGDTVPNSPPVKKAGSGAPPRGKPKNGTGDCFLCGSVEHWRSECPQLLKGSK